jgi:hypothetical protein
MRLVGSRSTLSAESVHTTQGPILVDSCRLQTPRMIPNERIRVAWFNSNLLRGCCREQRCTFSVFRRPGPTSLPPQHYQSKVSLRHHHGIQPRNSKANVRALLISTNHEKSSRLPVLCWGHKGKNNSLKLSPVDRTSLTRTTLRFAKAERHRDLQISAQPCKPLQNLVDTGRLRQHFSEM